MSEQEEVKAKLKDPEALAKLMERTMTAGAAAFAGGSLIPRSYVTFDVDADSCSPGMFAEDISLTLESLTSGEEMKAVGSAQNGSDVMHLQAKASIYMVNGTKIDQNAREFLWEALGRARQVVILMYAEIGAAPPAALGKAQATTTRS